MADRKRPWFLVSFLLLLFSLAFLYFAYRYSNTDFRFLKGFFAPRRYSASWSILEEIRDMKELETASYEMKVVFPFDFTAGEDVDWGFLKYQYDRSPAQFHQKSDPSWYPEGVLPSQWKYAGLYALCREADIDPGRPDRRFLVISTSIHAGIDLQAWLESFHPGSPEEEVAGIEVTESENGLRSLTLNAPPVEITSFIIEDRDAAAEGFPDVPLAPEEWGVLISGLEPSLRDMAFRGGLLERAETEGHRLLREIFKAAGYDSVSFTES